MKKIPLISVIVFIILSITFIIYQNFSSDSFGSEFVEQIRIADAEDTLENIPENALVNIGKNICITFQPIRTLHKLVIFYYMLFNHLQKNLPSTVRTMVYPMI